MGVAESSSQGQNTPHDTFNLARYIQSRDLSRIATLLSDGALDVDGAHYSTPSGAARAVSGTCVNGWWFWLREPQAPVRCATSGENTSTYATSTQETTPRTMTRNGLAYAVF